MSGGNNTSRFRRTTKKADSSGGEQMRVACHFIALILVVGFCFIASAVPAMAQGISYEVTERVTNNRIVGWEHQLTDRDPNLSKWHWEPINTSSHAVDVRKIVDPANPNAPISKYAPPHYVKPNHVAMPVVSHGENGSARASSELSGRLVKKNSDTPLTAQARPTAAYGDYMSREYSSVGTNAARTNVIGNIVHKSGRHSACNETPKYF
jgi:hypothetical protein